MVAIAKRLSTGLLALTCSAQAQTPVKVEVDATASGAPLERVWAFHGYDEVNYTSLPEGKALLATLADLHSAPVHIRNHFLLNSGDRTPAPKWGSTNVYTEDQNGNAVYDWSATDDILSTITRAGALPLVELGFMPEALSTHATPYVNSSTLTLNGGCFYPPRDYSKWADLIRTWASHANATYPDSIQRWLWELWNEPDSAYWHGSFEEYAKLYDYTESALHAVLPDAPLAGPAVIDPAGDFLTRFLEHCRAGQNAVTGDTGTRLDSVSFHAKGGVAVTGDRVQLNLGHQLQLHRAGFQAVAASAGFEKTPIYITEADPDGCAACPASIVPGAEYRMSTAYGAYELAMMKRSLELAAAEGVKLAGVVTWAFTFPGSAYFAGYRELATNGIHLPVLGAFKLLGNLSGSRVPLTSSAAHVLSDILASGVRAQPDVDGMAALDGSTLRVLIWNYHDELAPSSAAEVHLALQLPQNFGNRAHVSHLRVDETHGDAHAAWLAQGMPASPSAAQVAALERAMDPELLDPDRTIDLAEDGSSSLDFELPRFGVSLITITPADSSDSGLTGDENVSGMSPQDKTSLSRLEARGGCACNAGRTAPSERAPLFGMSTSLLAALARRALQRSKVARGAPQT